MADLPIVRQIRLFVKLSWSYPLPADPAYRIVLIQRDDCRLIVSQKTRRRAEELAMKVGLWTRWAAMHGIPRAVMRVRALKGDRSPSCWPVMAAVSTHTRSTTESARTDR